MRLFRIIKYWFKLLTTTNCILKESYNVLLDLSDGNTVHNYNWVTFLKNNLMLLGFGDLWLSQPYVNEKKKGSLIKTRIFDQAKQNLYSILNNSSKCILYKHVVDNLCLQLYLQKYIPKHHRILLTKLRLSAHMLAVETGRYRNIEI